MWLQKGGLLNLGPDFGFPGQLKTVLKVLGTGATETEREEAGGGRRRQEERGGEPRKRIELQIQEKETEKMDPLLPKWRGKKMAGKGERLT